MSRSGYGEGDCFSDWAMICYRGLVASSFRGERGIKLLREMRAALDALPEKKLIAHELQREDGACCAIGAVGKLRGIDMTDIDAESATDDGVLAKMFDVPNAMIREIEYENDGDDRYWYADYERDPKTSCPIWEEHFDEATQRTMRSYKYKYKTNADGERVDKNGRTKDEFEARADSLRWDWMSRWVDATLKASLEYRQKKGWKAV